MSGAYEFKRPDGQPPVGSPMGGLGDIVTALFAVIGTQAALRQRDRTGRGQRVDVAMLDAMVAVLDVVPNFWSLGMPMGTPWPGILHGFRAADGWFMLQVLRAHQWPDLARAIGRPEWADDPRFATPQGWLDHLESDIRPALESWAGSPDQARGLRRPQRGRSRGRARGHRRRGGGRSAPGRAPHARRAPAARRRRPTGADPGAPREVRRVAEGPETQGALARRAHRRGARRASSGSVPMS